ncbi:filamentous hemagglutinin N-terminal domain-containing protein [Bradyrhizobium sp. CSA112]|uniref:filamentous haemagglutinin family protein n=1 Tax=Bradyrhizobium sp. CSA112 TaxID=2699170 RepID=UPI0023AEB055|nr:filamentous haemagglutinin family protein [Bradyrhizobium sp. CSA112]MDE5458292.1 filamentous hemagglutinin N-terminal domain-containing protein [Bradyrhizobium sp. CSA112]
MAARIAMPSIMSVRRGPRHALLAGVSIAALLACAEAMARPLGGQAPNPSAATVAAAQSGAQQAARAAQQAQNSLKRATQAIQAMQAAQSAARAAANAAPSVVPNGLGPGGLQVAPGAIPGSELWRGANLPTEASVNGRTKVNIKQTQQKAILTWQTFNVGHETDLTFDQKAGGADASQWSVLNRVLDPSLAPSRILGTVAADGAVYVINRNGVIFGGTSQVNVGTLIASSLDIHGGAVEYQAGATEQQKLAARNQRFIDGILAANPPSSQSVPLTFFDGTDMNAATNRVKPGETFAAYDGVTVEAGAQIAVGTLGQAVLLGHNVVNRGRIDAPDGQVLMAAGRGVLLLDGTLRDALKNAGEDVGGAPIRGFLAGVDRGGLAENTGLIVVERGNITLTGKTVGQNGVLISTTAAETAGSILIQAESGMTSGTNHTRNLYGTAVNVGQTQGMFPYVVGERGTASFGEGSYAAILPDLSGEKVVGNPYKPSTVEVYGNSIIFQTNAALYVPAGDISLVAKQENGPDSSSADDSRIYLAAGATLDVSGLRDVEIAMEQNTIRAELRANELSDNPVMRDSSLRGGTVYFDARYGSKLTDGTGIANLKGYYDLIERDVSQFMTVGGKISMTAMEIIARQGSIIDLSGGSVRYLDGYVQSTRLVAANGARVPIEQAQAGVVYIALEGGFIRHHARWGITEQWTSFSRSGRRFEKGYNEGRSAGSLLLNNVFPDSWTGSGGSISTDAIRIFDGEIVSDIVVGERQRSPSTGVGVTDVTRIWRERPSLATLSFGSNYIYTTIYDANPIGGNIAIGGDGPRLGESFNADTALLDYTRGLASVYEGVQAHQHVLPSKWFDGSTFGNVTLVSGGSKNGILTIGEGTAVDVGAFGTFTFIGRQAEIAGTIRAAGGKVHIEALRSTAAAGEQSSSSIAWDTIPEADRPSIHLGKTGVIDVAGRWTNDRAGATGVLPVVDGGKVELISRTILLDKGSLIDASGGGHLSASGKITAGDGGSILIDTATPYINTKAPAGLATGRLEMKGDIVAYALGKGGSLTIDTGDDVIIGDLKMYENGVLPANTQALRDLLLASDIVIPAGSYVPVAHTVTLNRLGPSEAAPVWVGWPQDKSMYVAANWVVPPSFDELYDASFNGYYPGDVVPAGTTLPYVFGGFNAGYVIPADVFPQGVPINPISLTVQPGPWSGDVTLRAGTVIPKGAHLEQSVNIVPPVTVAPDFFTKGGFASYALSGARGMTVTSGTVIAPTVDTMVLNAGDVQGLNGVRLYDLLREQKAVSLQNSSELPEGLREPMELTLGTAPFSPDGIQRPIRVTGTQSDTTVGITQARHPGKLVIETGAEIRMDAESTVRLDSLVDVFVDGTISTPGGTIHIQPNGGEPYSGQNGSVRLGANARLLAGGYQKFVPGPDGGRRSVEAGGSVLINFAAAAGDGQTLGTVLIDREAVIDVSGVHGIADVDHGGAPTLSVRDRYVPVDVDGAAGSIAIYATYGVVAGDLRLSAGGTNGYGGTLTIGTGYTHPQVSGIVIAQSAPVGFGEVTQTSPTTGYSSLSVSADVINRSGADDLFLLPGEIVNNHGIVFDGDVTLSTRRSITLASYNLSTGPGVSANAGSVELVSSYVNFQGYKLVSQSGMTAPSGTAGRLTIRADLIDISGGTKIGGFGETSFIATGDIRLAGNDGTPGTLTTAGSLLFDAAQLYIAPGTVAYQENARELPEADPGFLVNAGISITVRSNGRAAPVPMSYGQRLTLRAPVIDQGGVVRAPQGQIRLEASQTLTLRPGSLTSASLEGLTVPFGYLNSAGLFGGYQIAGWVPSKSVKLAGPDVDVQAGAVVDVSGGGDLLGWSFVGGIGGSTNILAGTSVERYAILPNLGAAPGPTSNNAPGLSLQDSRLKVGDTVYLDSVPGLKAGYYTLLPAHYALLEGGMLVEPLGGSTAVARKAVTLPDGSQIASGYRSTLGGAIRDTGYNQFRVMNNATWKQYSEFKIVSFNQSARELAEAAGLSTVRTPADAGTVILAASRSLNLDGTGRLSGNGGLLGNLDVSAAKIALVSGSAATPADVLRLDAQQLEDFGAGSVLIGGTRSIGTTGTTIAVGASEVTVYDNAHFTAPEIILAASSLVEVRSGASLTAEGPASVDANPLQMSGNGALLRLSTGQRVGLVRTGSNGAAGVLAVVDDAALRTSGSISFDGSNAINLATRTIIEAAQLDLASVTVNLGEVPAGTAGTTFTEDMLERFAAASDVLIRGHESINLHGTVELGRRDARGVATLKALTLDSGLIQGIGASAHQPKITAQALSFRNSGAARGYAGPDTAAALNLDIDRLLLGPGNVSLGGFHALQGRVGELRTSGTGTFNVVNASTGGVGYVALDVGRITAAAASDYTVAASGALQLNKGFFAGSSADAPFGGRLALRGASVSFGTQALLPAGVIDIRATSGDLVIGNTAILDMSGRSVDFLGLVGFAPGGSVRLEAPGRVSLAAGSLIDVSGSARGGDAGRIDIVADIAQIEATLRAHAAIGHVGGSFTLDARQLAGSSVDFGTAFYREISMRLREQSIVVGAGQQLSAHRVMLRSDKGWVDIHGKIAASGDLSIADGGDVRLIGGQGVRLYDGARIEAQVGAISTNGYAPASGVVELASTGTRSGAGDTTGIYVANGAVIDVSGGRAGGGRILMRANASAGDDLNAIFRVAHYGSGVYIGARESVLVGVRNYDVATVDAAKVSEMLVGLQATPASTVAGFVSMAGALFRNSSGDLTIASAIDLGGSLSLPSWIGFEAKGDILVNATISDGFQSDAKNAALKSGSSFNLNFDSGQDIIIGANAIVRTGTGEIRMDARRDIELKSNTSVIYTAGRKKQTEAGFVVGSKHGDYPTAGGDIVLIAGQDIKAPVVTQSTAAWLFHYGETNWTGDPAASTVKDQTSWSIVFANFESGVGALGGGDVRVRAGRDSKDLSVAIPTTGHLTTPTTPAGAAGPVARAEDLVIRGGGNLDIETGRDLLGGVYMLGRGHAEFNAGNRIVASGASGKQRTTTWSPVPVYTDTPVNMLLGLMDATASLTAVGDITIEGIYDPMLIGQVAGNLNVNRGSGFVSYSDRTAVDAVSTSGKVVYQGASLRAADLSLGGSYEVQLRSHPLSDLRLPLLQSKATLLPPTLRLASLQSDVSIATKQPEIFGFGATILAPGASGTLELLANNDVLLNSGQQVRMEDIAPQYRRGALAPFRTELNSVMYLGVEDALPQPIGANSNWERGFIPLHVADTEPARLYALNGTIGTTLGWSLTAPKPVDIHAGEDILYPSIIAQNNNPLQVSSVIAGRDIIRPQIAFLGEGMLWVEAGRDLTFIANRELLLRGGIMSTGNVLVSNFNETRAKTDIPNLALPDKGGDINIIAGTKGGADYAGFAAIYLDPRNASDPTLPLSHPDNAGKVVRTYEKDLGIFLKDLGYAERPADDQRALFASLPKLTQQAFLQQVLFTELKETGIDYNNADSLRFKQYTRGYSAIERLFPASPAAVSGGWGDVMLRGGIVQTQSGGNISIMAPYGQVTVGYDSEETKNYGLGGIVTRRGGDVRIMGDGSIDLYVSRVFTLQGGDLTMWTSNGNISAGAGAKTSVFNVPLKFTMDNDARVSVDAFGLSTGAGIGVLDANRTSDASADAVPPPPWAIGDTQPEEPGKEQRKKSRMDLLAFKGEINAGDAGIRVFGDANFGALRIINANNITVSGAAIGVPTVQAPNIGSLTEASNVAGAAAQATTPPTQSRGGEQPSIIIVEVLGFGGGDGGESQQQRQDEERRQAPGRQSYDPNSTLRVVGNGPLAAEQATELTAAERSQLTSQIGAAESR